MPDRPATFGRKRTKARAGGSATLRDTSAAYQRLRVSILDDQPLCTYCMGRGHVTPADVLDHILALSLGGSNDRTNLAPACTPCNDAKGRDETRYLRRGYALALVRFDPALAEWFRLARHTPSLPK
jgi:5-methylcytosine-specific restriction endonuclease McrA